MRCGALQGGSVDAQYTMTVNQKNLDQVSAALGAPVSPVDLLRRTVERSPETHFIIHGDRRVRYRDLWRDVTALARFLRQQGLGHGDRVGILMPNSPEYVAAYYGVLAAGGVAVTLNTNGRAREISSWLVHSEAQWLIADASHAELGHAVRDVVSLRVVTIGSATMLGRPVVSWQEALEIGVGDDSAIHIPAADDMAAILYTSGTTGRPKGVVLTHGNLASNTRSIVAYLGLGPSDRCLNVLPFYYSYGNSVLHTHAAVGGSLVLENSLVYPHRVIASVASERATGFAGVPSTYALLLQRVRLEEYHLDSLRYMTQAGGPMPPANISKLRAALPQVRLFVMYGQTEATARLTYLPPERLAEKLGSVGVPIPDVAIQIRDERGQEVKRGDVGEVCAQGPNIMRGYWKDPMATAEVVQANWLRTGDLGYMDEDGYIFLQGRSKDMIKSGAHRINPVDIEEVISELPEVLEVAVVGLPDDILGQVIKAVIVVQPGASLQATAVKAHCHARLASYKVPRHVEFADQLPKTASGKIQRFRLISEAQNNA